MKISLMLTMLSRRFRTRRVYALICSTSSEGVHSSPCPSPPWDKPVILFYPPTGTAVHNLAVSVTLTPEFSFTSVYPKAHCEELTTTAAKAITWDVDRVDSDGSVTLFGALKKYTNLFWEFSGDHNNSIIGLPAVFGDVASTFHTDSAHAADFFAELLDTLGMTPRERDDMVTYWLHAVQSAPHLLVRVVSQRDLEACAALSVTPKTRAVVLR